MQKRVEERKKGGEEARQLERGKDEVEGGLEEAHRVGNGVRYSHFGCVERFFQVSVTLL